MEGRGLPLARAPVAPLLTRGLSPPMLFLLVRKMLDWLEAHDLGFLRVFTFPTFQSVVSVIVAFLMCVLLGPGVIEWLRRQRSGTRQTSTRSSSTRSWRARRGRRR